MNPAGIPVFYGATSAPLTFSEIRPPVGSRVFTGEFEILRSLRVLNADALAELDTSGSFFDPDYKGDLTYTDFFKTLKSRISRAVLPGDEELDYLPTQAIAEYLARRFDPPFDGILFESAQMPRYARRPFKAARQHRSNIEKRCKTRNAGEQAPETHAACRRPRRRLSCPNKTPTLSSHPPRRRLQNRKPAPCVRTVAPSSRTSPRDMRSTDRR